jgi:hypothetical protein
MSVLFDLSQRYPQLYLAPAEGLSKTDAYSEIVRRGKPSGGGPLGKHFTGSRADKYFLQPTPAGNVEVIFLKNRADFETFYRIMGCRGELAAIPATMGAVTISGIINWRKIETHKKEYEASGGDNWNFEFEFFTMNPDNFKDVLILVSEGAYSAVPAKEAGLSSPDWLKKSLIIRTYHEITHFICAKKYPDKKHAVWDEIMADGIGLIFALGRYDTALAKRFLGVSEAGYTMGRLENYRDASGLSLNDLAKNVCALIDALQKRTHRLRLDTDKQKFAVIDKWQAMSREYILRYQLGDISAL